MHARSPQRHSFSHAFLEIFCSKNTFHSLQRNGSRLALAISSTSLISFALSSLLASAVYWLNQKASLPGFSNPQEPPLRLSNSVCVFTGVRPGVSLWSALTGELNSIALRCWAARKRNAGYPGSSSLWSAYPRWLLVAQGFLRSVQWVLGQRASHAAVCGDEEEAEGKEEEERDNAISPAQVHSWKGLAFRRTGESPEIPSLISGSTQGESDDPQLWSHCFPPTKPNFPRRIEYTILNQPMF